MRPSLLLPLLLVLVANGCLTDANLEDACKSIAGVDNNFDFCVTSLQVVKGSHTADYADLSIIAGELAMANATSTISTIKKLLKEENFNETIASGLRVCVGFYRDSIDDTKEGLSLVKSQIRNTIEYLGSAITWIETCKDGFTDFNVESPLTKEDSNVEGLLGLSLSFAAKLKRS